MARRKTSLLDNLFEVAALVPWWASVASAALAYTLLHQYAATPIPQAISPHAVSQMMHLVILKGLAQGGQYLLPMIFLGGAFASFLSGRKRGALLTSASTGGAAAITSLTWQEFEHLVGEVFRQRGFSVVETGGGGADGGLDLVAKRGGETYLIQCKQWRAFKVPVTIVRELYGLMAAKGAAGGFVVTSGTFTEDAKSFTSGRNIELVDGPALSKVIASLERRGVTSANAPAALVKRPAESGLSHPCPKCGGSMVLRIAKRGLNAGNAFWGCTKYPSCNGVRSA